MGRTGDGSEERAEAGFTLIELMVVLLIMAILLAIAIPTFLGVTAGAKKTATQSNLTTSIDSATALYTKTSALPITKTTAGTKSYTATAIVTAMHATQTTIKYVKATVAPTAGKNVVGLEGLALPGLTTAAILIMTAVDGTTACWAVTMNETGSTVTLTAAAGGGTGVVKPGNHYYGWKKGTAKYPSGCKATSVAKLAAATMALVQGKTNFKTIKNVT
jgi:type IV pilus assembly protein PilA